MFCKCQIRFACLDVYQKGRLVYAGLVGTGFAFKQRSDLKKHLDKFSRQNKSKTKPKRIILRA